MKVNRPHIPSASGALSLALGLGLQGLLMPSIIEAAPAGAPPSVVSFTAPGQTARAGTPWLLAPTEI